MSKRRSTKELLEEAQFKEKQMKEREKALRQRLAKEERKARTKKLIEIGAEVESVYGKPIEKDKLPLLRKFLLDLESKDKQLTKALANEEVTKDE